jgi:hypothetical protein
MEWSRPDVTNTTAAGGPLRQKAYLRHAASASLDFHIAPFSRPIDRASVSQHETALLISGAIPILITGEIPLSENTDDIGL